MKYSGSRKARGDPSRKFNADFNFITAPEKLVELFAIEHDSNSQ